MTSLGGPKYFGGPFSYDKCEEERIKLPAETATKCCQRGRTANRNATASTDPDL